MAEAYWTEYRLQQAILQVVRARTNIEPMDLVTTLGEEGEPIVARLSLTWDQFVQLVMMTDVLDNTRGEFFRNGGAGGV